MKGAGFRFCAALAIARLDTDKTPLLRGGIRTLMSGVLAIVLVVAPAVRGEDILPNNLDAAVERGLAFLAKQQNADGSCDGGGPRIAMTGLTVMAFLASGHTADVGKFGLTVRRGVDFLVKQQPADGYFGKVEGSRMYGHGIATLALVEALGAETVEANRVSIRAALEKAVKIILDAQDVEKDQNNSGGWRYEPTSTDSDLSLSGWNALALRAAQDVGIHVPKDRVQRAVEYVMKCYRADEKGFAYQPGGEASVAMTGTAVLSLYLMDAADRPELGAATQFLLQNSVNEQTRFHYYALYYATQAAYQAGDSAWPAVWQNSAGQLLGEQVQQDGGWPVSRTVEEPGRVYATSMAILTLSVPYRLLPIYQR